tara:strand:- start:542 stop:949 length:408 start_codon:yes stop_codon:yes gene_type:complete
MSNFKPYAMIAKESLPSRGGLAATNYPAPYGSRAFPTKDGYGGSAMPKTKGWQGLIPSLDGTRNITEYSLGGENGEPFYPIVTQNMTPAQILSVRKLEGGVITMDSEEAQGLLQNARKEYLRHKAANTSAFMDYN